MSEIKVYLCKICKREKKEFVGTRREVRKHLREEHLVRGKRKTVLNVIMPSKLTENTIVMDFEEYFIGRKNNRRGLG